MPACKIVAVTLPRTLLKAFIVSLIAATGEATIRRAPQWPRRPAGRKLGPVHTAGPGLLAPPRLRNRVSSQSNGAHVTV
jgi:hypothetical protein